MTSNKSLSKLAKFYNEELKGVPKQDGSGKGVGANIWRGGCVPTKRSKFAKFYNEHVYEDELRMGIKVEMEHTTDPEIAKKIALDHLKEDINYYTKLQTIEGVHSGLAQIPDDYKKNLDGKVNKYPSKMAKFAKYYNEEKELVAGVKLPKTKTARHEIGMKDWAELDITFLREGTFATNGKEYKYPWEVISNAGETFKGKEFYINHADTSGTEVGIIENVYIDEEDGMDWLCATVKIPEVEFNQEYLDRIENGLIRFVSSTHGFATDEDGRTVKSIRGKGISTVKEGEVEGARIRNVRRHVNLNNLKLSRLRGLYQEEVGEINA